MCSPSTALTGGSHWDTASGPSSVTVFVLLHFGQRTFMSLCPRGVAPPSPPSWWCCLAVVSGCWPRRRHYEVFPPLSVWKSLRMIGVSSPLFSAESRKDVSFSTICCTRGPTQRVAPPPD